jgi:hypothetical protein
MDPLWVRYAKGMITVYVKRIREGRRRKTRLLLAILFLFHRLENKVFYITLSLINAMLYVCLLSSLYLFRFHCITTALINAVVMQWNAINYECGSSEV